MKTLLYSVYSGLNYICWHCWYKTHLHISVHNFLNIQLIFNPQNVLERWDRGLFNHTICNIMTQPLCTGSTSVLVVKAAGLGYGSYLPTDWLLWARTCQWAVSHQQTLPGMWWQTHHPKSLADGACSVTSPHMSFSCSIKVVAPHSRGVLLPLQLPRTLVPQQPEPNHNALSQALLGTSLFEIN